jgi:hypothetical protein
MANVQLAIAGDETTQVILSVPGVQGPAGSNLPASGTTHQLLYKQSNTNYDTAWKLLTNDNVDAAAAIAGTKISPNFGSQNVVTTGTSTAASFIPTSSSVPANGLYLPSANNVAISTAGSGRLFVDGAGAVGVNTNTSSIQSIGRLVVQNASTTAEERFIVAANAYLSGPTYTGTYVQQGDTATTGTSFGLSRANLGALIFQNTSAGLIGCNSGVPLVFGTSGQERLRITSAGTVNIVGAGTAGVTQAVSFNGSAPVNSLVVGASGNITLGTSDLAASGQRLKVTGGTIEFDPGSGADATRAFNFNIGAVNFAKLLVPTGSGGALAIHTGSSGAVTERLRITSTGTVNIVGAGTAGSTQAVSFNGSAPVNSLVLTSGGLVGIGTTTASETLHVAGNALIAGTSQSTLTVGSGSFVGPHAVNVIGGGANIDYGYRLNGAYCLYTNTGATGPNLRHTLAGPTGGNLVFNIGTTESARLTPSGQFLVGTSSARSNVYYGANQITPTHQYEFNLNSYNTGISLINYNNTGYAPVLTLGLSQSATQGTNTALAGPNTDLGIINFTGNDGTNFRTGASIIATTDAAVSTGDLPTRLVFSTTADGASSPTERLIIKNTGAVYFNVNSEGNNVIVGAKGYAFIYGASSTKSALFGSNSDAVASFDRSNTDGTLLEFSQDLAVEGTISVSGTTVSYNGAHLSRWSQLPGGAERTEILRGSVLSSIDEMCEWGEEDNEQLNRMKVSDVEGDKNVSGVFQAWDDDDDTYTNDFYCAMTGDFIIRIAEGVTVERGDLLMSAGDGTAKSQDDDIIRSKTIAKVTSTNVSCTYDDGSYCVPCVLMAC